MAALEVLPRLEKNHRKGILSLCPKLVREEKDGGSTSTMERTQELYFLHLRQVIKPMWQEIPQKMGILPLFTFSQSWTGIFLFCRSERVQTSGAVY